MPVDRKSITLPLAHYLAAQALSSVVIVTMRTGEVELTATTHEEISPGLKEWLRGTVDLDIDKHSS